MSSCHACGAALPSGSRIARREACAGCGADLHCCRNCRFYSPGMYNDCAEPQAERVVDPERANFCDHFAPGGAARPAALRPAVRASLESLFKKRES